ncbi:amidase [Bacillus sp. SA1-12]|uniref:amidase n=1 Tax=Bacillus sp. SA1-12 TaxID=1455638 RepID=UPI0006273CB7|nr:amidase [Bacillus sp. SA1-12]KKI90439.1 amidase [Bacillus sp. SA1-12]
MNDKWNAFVNEGIVLEPLEEGPLDGFNFTVKDVFSIKGYTNTAGNPDWYRTHKPATDHAPVISTLLQQGAKLTGTVHTDELMYSLNGENVHYGTPINPTDPTRIPGGSSSGSAVAVSAGVVDFALGTDTGGSVRIPSSYCGIYGFRPTHGVVPIEGIIPLAKSFDTVGWMTKDSRLLIEVGEVLLNGQNAEEGFRHIFLGEDAWGLLDRENKGALLLFFQKVMNKADHCEWRHIAEEGLAEWANTFRVLQGLEIWEEHGEWIQNENPKFGRGISERFKWASTLNKEECKRQFQLRQTITDKLSYLLGEESVFVIPTAPGAAPLVNLHGEKAEQYRSRAMQLTCIAGLAGLPQITIPVNVNGLPIGLSFIANRHNDRKLLHWVHALLLDK